MGLLRAFIFGFGIFIIVGLAFLVVRNGVFSPVEFSVEDRGPIELIYKEHTGPYHKVIEDLNFVEKAVKDAGLPCPETFGEYLDDPNAVEMERLKSNVGCVTTATGAQAPAGLKQKTLSPRKYLVAKFTGSPALGPYKVYGKAGSQMTERRLQSDGAVIEIYKVLDGEGLETTYLFPVR